MSDVYTTARNLVDEWHSQLPDDTIAHYLNMAELTNSIVAALKAEQVRRLRVSHILSDVMRAYHGSHKGTFADCQIWTCKEAREALAFAESGVDMRVVLDAGKAIEEQIRQGKTSGTIRLGGDSG